MLLEASMAVSRFRSGFASVEILSVHLKEDHVNWRDPLHWHSIGSMLLGKSILIGSLATDDVFPKVAILICFWMKSFSIMQLLV